MSKYYISTYATSPSPVEWNADKESEYYKNLVENDKIIGIEHPYIQNSDRYPADWLKENVPDKWDIIITIMPSVMNLIKANENIGLASKNEEGRLKAIALMEEVNSYCKNLNNLFDREVVKAVHFHSAPKNEDGFTRGDKESFIKSLNDIKKFDWGNIELNFEHCDAFVPGNTSAKGFLKIEDEIEALNSVGGYGIVLNWARSVIEFRSSQGAIDHLKQSIDSSLLKGFFFSGCTDVDGNKYGAWRDSHMPIKNFDNKIYLPDESLLGKEEIRQVFDLTKNEDIYYGIKVQDINDVRNVERSVGLNIESLEELELVWNS